MGNEYSAPKDLSVIDDDSASCRALMAVFTLAGYRVATFADGETFLACARGRPPAAVLLDLHLPGKSGLAVLMELDARRYPAPILMMSGDTNIVRAIEAFKGGAVDYLLKPMEAPNIVARMRDAIADFNKRTIPAGELNRNRSSVKWQGSLTAREHEVLSHIAAGATSKEVAVRLAISPRTVDAHRGRIMDKIGARNTAELVRIVLITGRSNESPILGPMELSLR
jgi:two-component system response regulator FixJ